MSKETESPSPARHTTVPGGPTEQANQDYAVGCLVFIALWLFLLGVFIYVMLNPTD